MDEEHDCSPLGFSDGDPANAKKSGDLKGKRKWEKDGERKSIIRGKHPLQTRGCNKPLKL